LVLQWTPAASQASASTGCTLAGLPPQTGIYGYLLGGLGYALLGSSRQLAVGPTSVETDSGVDRSFSTETKQEGAGRKP